MSKLQACAFAISMRSAAELMSRPGRTISSVGTMQSKVIGAKSYSRLKVCFGAMVGKYTMLVSVQVTRRCPSGAERATCPIARSVLAPGQFSTITGWVVIPAAIP